MGTKSTNDFNTFLFTPENVAQSFVQSIGPVYPSPFDLAYSNFSLDGTKYVTGASEGYLTVFDFDRCSGLLSNPVTIYNMNSYDPINNPATGCSSVILSPNASKLYAANNILLIQYDLLSADVQSSRDTIYFPDTSDLSHISFLGLAMNGKIYGSTWGGGWTFMHVVNRPDEKGDSALFVRGGQPTLSANSMNISNMPNYRLGVLAGSGCDTLPTGVADINKANLQPKLYPNPADKWLYVEMPQQGDYIIELYNHIGQLVERKRTRQVDTFDTGHLPEGVYYLKATDRSRPKNNATAKVVIAR
jgi:hypothetical protein